MTDKIMDHAARTAGVGEPGLADVPDWKCCGCGKIAPLKRKACDCPTGVLSRRVSDKFETCWAIDGPLMDDLNYLEGAEAHGDEGPIGEPAAKAILAIALRYVREVVRTGGSAPTAPSPTPDRPAASPQTLRSPSHD